MKKELKIKLQQIIKEEYQKLISEKINPSQLLNWKPGLRSPKFEAIYARLLKPIDQGKKIKIKYKDKAGFDRMTQIEVNNNISNEAKIVVIDLEIGYYAQNELFFIKDLGFFHVNKPYAEELKDFPEEYKKYLNK